jgi:nicotinamide-nucleotide amidase
MTTDTNGIHVAQQLVSRLQATGRRLVLAESCTGGLVAATLTSVPGVSEWWCGSAVTYREDTKVRWLGVSSDSIQQMTAVSEPVARQMAVGVLEQTPEADLSAAITGHLGPDSPQGQDGLVFIAIASRDRCEVSRHVLQQIGRLPRQQEAAQLVLTVLIESMK